MNEMTLDDREEKERRVIRKYKVTNSANVRNVANVVANVVANGRKCMVTIGRKRSKIIENLCKLLQMVTNGRKCSQIVVNGHKRSQMLANGREQSKTVVNSQKRSRMFANGRE